MGVPIRNELLSVLKRLDVDTRGFIVSVWTRLDVNKPLGLDVVLADLRLGRTGLMTRLAESYSHLDDDEQILVECLGITSGPAEYLINFDPSCVFAHNIWMALVMAAAGGKRCSIIATAKQKQARTGTHIQFSPPHAFRILEDVQPSQYLVAVSKPHKHAQSQWLNAKDVLLIPSLVQFAKPRLVVDNYNFLEIRKLFEAAVVAGRLFRAHLSPQFLN